MSFEFVLTSSSVSHLLTLLVMMKFLWTALLRVLSLKLRPSQRGMLLVMMRLQWVALLRSKWLQLLVLVSVKFFDRSPPLEATPKPKRRTQGQSVKRSEPEPV